MAKKGDKLKWNTNSQTTLEKVRKRVSGEKDARGRLVEPKVRPEQAAGQASRAAKSSGARTRARGKSK